MLINLLLLSSGLFKLRMDWRTMALDIKNNDSQIFGSHSMSYY